MWVDLVPIYTRSKAGLVFIISPFTPPLTHLNYTSSHCPFTSVMQHDPLQKLPYPTDNFNQNFQFNMKPFFPMEEHEIYIE